MKVQGVKRDAADPYNLLLDRVRCNDPNLNELNVVISDFSHHHVVELCEALENNTHITILRIHARKMRIFFGELTRNSFHLLAGVKVEKVIIANHPITDEGAIYFAKAPHIRHLELLNCRITSKSASLFLKNKTLHHLTLTFDDWNENENKQKKFDKIMLEKCAENLAQHQLEIQSEQDRKFQLQTLFNTIATMISADNATELEQLILQVPQGINVSINGRSLLQKCMDSNAVNCVRYLLKAGVILKQTYIIDPALFDAAVNGQLELVKLLLPYSTDIKGRHYRDFKKPMSMVTVKLLSLLFEFFENHPDRKSRLNNNTTRMLESFLLSWRKLALPHQNNSGKENIHIYMLVRRTKDFVYKFAMYAGALIDDFTTIASEEETIEKLRTYFIIYKLLRKKRSIAKGKNLFGWEKYYEYLGCTIEDRLVEIPVSPVTSDRLSQQHVLDLVEKLNNSKRGLEEISDDSETLSLLYCVDFCVVKYSTDLQTYEKIEDDLQSCHLNCLVPLEEVKMYSDFPWQPLQCGYDSFQFNKLGQPSTKYLGKIYISLFSPLHDTQQLLFEGLLDLPDFSLEWNADIEKIYLERFNIDFSLYKYFRYHLASNVNSEKMKSELVNHITNHKAAVLYTVAVNEMKRRGGYLIFRQGQNRFTAHPSRDSTQYDLAQPNQNVFQDIFTTLNDQYSYAEIEVSPPLSRPKKRSKEGRFFGGEAISDQSIIHSQNRASLSISY